MLLNVLGGVTETSIEKAQMLEHPVFADEYINFMDSNDENDKDVGYMCIAANIIIPNEQYFDKPLMRCYDNITYQEALIYCIRCFVKNFH